MTARRLAAGAALVAGYVGLLSLFWTFGADDAYIAARYADNLVTDGALVYNRGEQIQAFTSPLHVFLLAALRAVFGDPVAANKLLAACVVAASLLFAARRIATSRAGAAVFLVATLLSPFVVFWTTGGLETPYLLALVTILVALAWDEPITTRRAALISVLAGLAFLTRFDSLLFTGAILVVLIRRGLSSYRLILALLLPGWLIAAVWLAFAKLYYGEVLPTSFYTKITRSLHGPNAVYEAQFIVISGALVVALAALWSVARSRRIPVHHGNRAWLYVALLTVAAYGQLVGTAHMMFSYRLFVPYLPALIAALLPDRRRPQRSVALIVPAILLLQGTLALIIYFGTVNPSLAARSEYRHESLRSYATFTRVLRAQAGDIARDWRRRQIDRPPRVYTYAEGVGPYYFPDEYVYGPLVSYRFDCHYDVRVTADYLQVIVPRHGTLEQQLPDWSQLTLISEHDIEFDGSRQRFLVYFRRAARPNLLPSTVAGACDGKPGRLARAEGNAERDNS